MRGFRDGLEGAASVCVAVLLFACGSLRGGVFAEEPAAAATRIVADYRVDLADFNLGTFRFTTLLTGSDYQMRGEGRILHAGWPCSTIGKALQKSSRQSD